MKKTISINIGGIIFHIEEEGFDILKNYLDSVNEYFSTFEDSKEIISDIESRIAEIFLKKLSASRQTINTNDVNELITTMGTTQDFDATIEVEPEVSAEEAPKAKSSPKGEKGKRLYRDTKRRIIGGVSAGIAHYFGIDPLWIRLLFIALFINVIPLMIGFFSPFSGIVLLIYIILWIVIPYNNELEDDARIKKLFRNPDSRVLGGVAGGIASYFGIDVSVVRLIFVASIFLGGAGVLIYIILWIITPEAKTITEKVQMEGEPVTLRTIEDTVKKNLRVKEGEEGPLVKILLFPFRLIALILKGLAKLLGPLLKFLVDAVRILFGAILVIDGFIWMIVSTALLLTIYGIGGFANWYNIGEVPIELIRYSLDPLVIFGTWSFLIFTSLGLFLLGLAIILKRKIVKAYVGWSLFALWVVSIIVISFSLPGYIGEFKSSNNYEQEQIFPVTENEIPTLRFSEEASFGPNLVELRLRGQEDSTYRLVVDIESRGANRNEARDNARSVGYEVEKVGDEILFDPKPEFPEGMKYRFQKVYATLYIPEGQTFRMDKELSRILKSTISPAGYRNSQIEGNDWVFEEGGLKCVTCPVDESTMSDESSTSYEDQMSYPFEDFREVKVTSLIDIDIRKGSEYKVKVYGDSEDLRDVYLNQVGDALEVKYKEDAWEWWEDDAREIKMRIEMPELEYLELVGKCLGDVRGFDEERLDITLLGASELTISGKIEELDISMAGASEMDLSGSGYELNAEIVGASKLKAFDFVTEKISLDVVGASSAEVYAQRELEIDAAGVSKVRYRGDAKVTTNEVGMSSVERD